MTKKKKKPTDISGTPAFILGHRASARAEVIGQIKDVLGGYEDILNDPEAFEDRHDAEAQKQSVEFQRDAVRFVLEYVQSGGKGIAPPSPSTLNLTPEDETQEV